MLVEIQKIEAGNKGETSSLSWEQKQAQRQGRGRSRSPKAGQNHIVLFILSLKINEASEPKQSRAAISEP